MGARKTRAEGSACASLGGVGRHFCPYRIKAIVFINKLPRLWQDSAYSKAQKTERRADRRIIKVVFSQPLTCTPPFSYGASYEKHAASLCAGDRPIVDPC